MDGQERCASGPHSECPEVMPIYVLIGNMDMWSLDVYKHKHFRCLAQHACHALPIPRQCDRWHTKQPAGTIVTLACRKLSLQYKQARTQVESGLFWPK